MSCHINAVPVSLLSDGSRPERTLSQDDRTELTARLFAELEQAREPDAQDLRQRIAELNIDLVQSLARRYRGRGESDEDLRQVGFIGLMKAVNGFRPDRGTDFVGYAVPTITGEIKKYFRDCCWTIRPSRRVQEFQAMVGEASQRITQDLGRSPTVADIAGVLGEKEDIVTQALSAHQYYSPRSLDAPVDGSEQNTLSALVGDSEVGFRRAEGHVMLIDAVRDLSDRDREILRLRFFEGFTQREIAAQIGVTQMQVSRLLAHMFDRLRAAIEPPTAHAPGSLPAA